MSTPEGEQPTTTDAALEGAETQTAVEAAVETAEQPDAIAEITAQRDAVLNQLREIKTTGALASAIEKHRGDPKAIADSKALQHTLSQLDTDSSEYEAAVSAAVKNAIAANTRLKADPPVTASSIEHGGTVTQPTVGVDAFRKSRRAGSAYTSD